MKKIIFLTACILASGVGQAAMQPGSDSTRKVKMEELKKLRRELFTRKLALTADEATKFFPIYDEYQLKLKMAKKEFRKKWKSKKQDEMSEEEAGEYLGDALKLRETELSLFKSYTDKLKSVISNKKVLKLPKVEREVQSEIIKKARELKLGAGAGNGGPKEGGLVRKKAKLKEKEKVKKPAEAK
jgi:hypothetical protein